MKMENNELDVRDYLAFNIKVFSLIGMWFPQKKPFLRVMYPFYSFIVIGILYTLYLISQFVYVYTVWGNLKEMVSVLLLAITIFGEYFKLYPFLIKSSDMEKMYNELITTKVFQPTTKHQEEMLRNQMRLAQKTSKYFILMCAFVANVWGLGPLFDGSYKTYNLPLTTYLPFDTNRSPNYQIGFAFMWFGVVMSALVNASYDTYFAGLLMYCAGQLDIMSDNLVNIKSKYDQFDDYTKWRQQEREFNTKIIHCVQHHMHILKFLKTVEDTVSAGAMAEFLSAGLVLVVTLFQITLVSAASAEFLMLSGYFTCIMSELFLFCWFGNEIALKSLQVSEAAYNCDWHVCGYKNFRRMLLVLMIRLKKPIQIIAGKFIPLSLITFMAIAKSSWSYFNLLSQVNE